MPSRLGHEGDGIPVRWVLSVGAGVALLLPLIMVGVWLWYRDLAGARYAGLRPPTLRAAQSEPTFTFPQPQLQDTPGALLKRMRAEEARTLNTYGWVDRSNGVVRIPIDLAMDLLLQRGLPVRGTNGNSVGPSEYDLTTQRRLESNVAPIKEIK